MAALIRHFTHEHPLGLVLIDDEFMCDGCNAPGSGERYHCQSCLFNLHNECAMSSANISSHFHPIHQLNLVSEKQEDAAAFFGHRPCNVCEEQVSGLYFACPVLSCNFFLHPICSQFPASVRHVTDTQHPLTVQYAKESECKICRGNCTGWRYRCGPCGINIHFECLHPPPPSPPANLHERRSRSLDHDQWKDRRPLDHQYRPQATGIPVGMQSSTPSPSIYGSLHHNHSYNCSQHNPYNKPGGDVSTGSAVGMPYSSPSYGASSQQYYLQPFSHSYNCSQHNPYNKPGGDVSTGSGVGMPYSSLSYGASWQQYYLQPFNNDYGPHKPDGSGHHHHGSPGGSQNGRQRKKMYAILRNILAAIVIGALLA